MSFFKVNPWGIDKVKVIKHYESQLNIFKSRELSEDNQLAQEWFNRYKLEKLRTKDGQLIEPFARKVLALAKKYTPKQDDDTHNKEHPTEPHLVDAYSIQAVHNVLGNAGDVFYGDSVCIINDNSYAAAVHEDFTVHHEYPTRANYLLSAAYEVSAEYNDPFDIFIKISKENIMLFIAHSDIRMKKALDNKYDLTIELVKEKYFDWSWDGIGDREYTRKEYVDLKKLAEKLGKGTPAYGVFSGIKVKETKEEKTIPGFVQIVEGRGTIEGYDQHLDNEQFVRLEKDMFESSGNKRARYNRNITEADVFVGDDYDKFEYLDDILNDGTF